MKMITNYKEGGYNSMKKIYITSKPWIHLFHALSILKKENSQVKLGQVENEFKQYKSQTEDKLAKIEEFEKQTQLAKGR